MAPSVLTWYCSALSPDRKTALPDTEMQVKIRASVLFGEGEECRADPDQVGGEGAERRALHGQARRVRGERPGGPIRLEVELAHRIEHSLARLRTGAPELLTLIGRTS